MAVVRLSVVPDPWIRPDGTRKHHIGAQYGSNHATGTVDFVGVDGEGINVNGEHRYVLLGCGQDQLEDAAGLSWWDILPWLYGFNRPKTAFVGFYLGYDFTEWLKSLPEDRARRLLTIEGKESRRSRSPKMKGKFLPVDLDDWQIDVLGSKRFSFRYRPCQCLTVKCPHKAEPWMHICDAGPFFQTSFLNTIDPVKWEHPIVTPAEWETIKEGKAARASAGLDDDMRRYNRLENEVLARVMRDLDGGMKRLGVTLPASGWYGPGQAAQAWMRGRAPTRKEITSTVPEWFTDATRASYFGGWFEQQAHGIIPGICHEYDINSAYPHIIRSLPCLLHGKYSQGVGKPPKLPAGNLCLVRALVWSAPPHSDYKRGRGIGAMLHRDRDGRITRPLVTAGWYWLHELQAAQRAGCVTRITADRFYEWVAYQPCDCLPPLRKIENLYQIRLDVGKKSSLGKSAKLVINSAYGKFAQSVGSPQFGNPVYASLITAGCRTMILDAIATHPKGKSNVVMVATDAVFFLDPHPLLIDGTGLGSWETTARRNLTLFKPGMYWDDDARATIRAGSVPVFKARGISAKDFAGSIAAVDSEFASWGDDPPTIVDEFDASMIFESKPWPTVEFTSGFALTSCLQALIRNEWHSAGNVDTAKILTQTANPMDKRHDIWLDRSDPTRPIYRSEPHTVGRNATWRNWRNEPYWETITEDFTSVPYEKRFGLDDPFSEESLTQWGITPDEPEVGRFVFRALTGQE